MKALGLILVLVAGAAQAQPACREEGDQVICTKDGFKTLTDLTLEFKAEATKCGLKLSAAQARVSALEATLGSTQVPTPQPVQPAKVPMKPVLAVVAGILGSAAITTAIAADMDPTNRAGLGLTGLCSLSAAFIIIAVP